MGDMLMVDMLMVFLLRERRAPFEADQDGEENSIDIYHNTRKN